MNELDTFLNRKKELEANELDLKKTHNIFGTLRLLSFIMIIFFLFLIVKKNLSLITILGLVFSIILFAFLLVNDLNISSRIKDIKRLLLINENYIKRINGTWTEFNDIGEEYIDLDHPYSNDLDIFGNNSLFQLINTTTTFLGRIKLSNILKSPDLNIEKIKGRQNAVKELSEKIKFCQKLQSEGMANKKFSKDSNPLLDYIESKDEIWNEDIFKLVINILPVLTLICLISSIILKLPILYYILFVLFLLHALINIISYINVYPVLNSIEAFNNSFSAYGNMLYLIENEKFSSPLLNGLQKNLYTKAKASTVLKKIDTIISAVNLRNNFLLYFILNLLLFWDYRCLFSLEKWKDNYRSLVRIYLETVADFEVISSLATISHLSSKLCYPTFSNNVSKIDGKNLGHPLIETTSRIYNDVSFKNNIFIITGSNMSGKTTFLRTIGINLVLAYTGAEVCADAFECGLLKVFTSMRISDDLSKGLSTFYVELTRIKTILNFLPTEEPMLFLIDEIFRGTNSNDRIIGAKTVLKHLNKPWCCGLISTHDFELCDLEDINEGKIKNYHFREDYIDNKIHFDYKLRSGRSDTTNAKYLMKMIGIDIE